MCNTFFAVVSVLMQHKTTPTLTAVAPKGVDALMLTATVLLGALVLICRTTEDTTTLTTARFEDLMGSRSE